MDKIRWALIDWRVVESRHPPRSALDCVLLTRISSLTVVIVAALRRVWCCSRSKREVSSLPTARVKTAAQVVKVLLLPTVLICTVYCLDNVITDPWNLLSASTARATALPRWLSVVAQDSVDVISSRPLSSLEFLLTKALVTRDLPLLAIGLLDRQVALHDKGSVTLQKVVVTATCRAAPCWCWLNRW